MLRDVDKQIDVAVGRFFFPSGGPKDRHIGRPVAGCQPKDFLAAGTQLTEDRHLCFYSSLRGQRIGSLRAGYTGRRGEAWLRSHATAARARTARARLCLNSNECDRLAGVSLLDRISIDPAVRFGKPCVRGTRITVGDVLGQLAGGTSEERLLDEFPQLAREDIRACLAYAAERERRLWGIPAA